MLHRTVWDAPSASSKKQLLLVSFKLGTGVENVTSNCMGRAVRQFDKQVSFRLETGLGYVTLNCMGRVVRQFEKEASPRLGTE